MRRPPWSIHTPLMKRTVCPSCGHMHRQVLRDRCDCCKRDAAEVSS